jgi:N-acetylmuramoyl-L-alanine amidase
MLVALVVGHSEKSQGARNTSYDVSEYAYNNNIAWQIAKEWSNYNLADNIQIIHRESGYKELPNQINELGPDLVVSLHCNAFDTTANGCEMLYYHKSTKGKEIARIFQNKIVQFLDNKDRGIKPRSSEDRGGYLLRYTHAPCIICEPFFIDNDEEWERATDIDNPDYTLVEVYCEAINDALRYLKDES